jgi:hypothetical protein
MAWRRGAECARAPALPPPATVEHRGMDLAKAEQILRQLAADHPYPAMVIDRILLDVQRAHGHAAVNGLIDRCDLIRRFGIRKVWPDGG